MKCAGKRRRNPNLSRQCRCGRKKSPRAVVCKFCLRVDPSGIVQEVIHAASMTTVAKKHRVTRERIRQICLAAGLTGKMLKPLRAGPENLCADCGTIITRHAIRCQRCEAKARPVPPKFHREPKDLAGRKFGLLTAIKICGRTPDRYAAWRCRCECGKETIVSAGRLMSGNTRSCGCTKIKWPHPPVGKTFGGLTVIGDSSDQILHGKARHPLTTWLCRCECGKQLAVAATYLTRGRIKSCGCRMTPGLRKWVEDSRGLE